MDFYQPTSSQDSFWAPVTLQTIKLPQWATMEISKATVKVLGLRGQTLLACFTDKCCLTSGATSYDSFVWEGFDWFTQSLHTSAEPAHFRLYWSDKTQILVFMFSGPFWSRSCLSWNSACQSKTQCLLFDNCCLSLALLEKCHGYRNKQLVSQYRPQRDTGERLQTDFTMTLCSNSLKAWFIYTIYIFIDLYINLI